MIKTLQIPRTNFIVLEDINKCNMHCQYCPHWEAEDKKNTTKLTAEDYILIYDLALSILKSQGTLEILHLFTEPLLNWQELQKSLVRLPRGIYHNIYTNGLALTDNMIQSLLANQINISISYDGKFQNERDISGETCQKIPKLVEKYPECFYLMMVIDKKHSLSENIENIKQVLKMPVMGVSIQLNWLEDWTEDEIYNFYFTLINSCNTIELYKLGFGSLKDGNSQYKLRFNQMRENALFINSKREVFQYISASEKIFIGEIDKDFSFLTKMKDISPQCFSQEINCLGCPLQSFQNNQTKICYPVQLSPVGCWIRLSLLKILGGNYDKK